MNAVRSLSVLLLPVLAVALHAADPWPQFLGPDRNGISTETGLNLDWKAKAPKVLWKVPLGPAFSSLAILDDRLITTTKRGDRDLIVCLRLEDGKELWAYDAAPSYIDQQKAGAGPRSTPTVVDGKVYCLFPRGELACVTLAEGKQVWKANIFEVSGAKDRAAEYYYWGLSASPLVEGDAVIVQAGGDKDNSVVALHRQTGKLLWMAGSDPMCYGSPIAITAAGRRQVVVPTGRSMLGLDPKTGAVLWRHVFGNQFDATCANPIWTGKLLIASAAYGAGTVALELKADGDKVVVTEKWKNKTLLALMATPIYHEGKVYGCSGDLGAQILRCLDVETGETAWEQRMAGRFALIAAEGHLLVLYERGTLQLIEMNPKAFVVKGELADLMSYKAWAMPALAKKRLYLRDQKNVVCLDLGKE
jgi:outer membrane protein assembly factor BamB